MTLRQAWECQLLGAPPPPSRVHPKPGHMSCQDSQTDQPSQMDPQDHVTLARVTPRLTQVSDPPPRQNDLSHSDPNTIQTI